MGDRYSEGRCYVRVVTITRVVTMGGWLLYYGGRYGRVIAIAKVVAM